MMGVLVTLQNGIEIKYWSVTKLEYDLNASSQGWIYIQGDIKNRGYVSYDKLHSGNEPDAVKSIELRAFKVSEYDQEGNYIICLIAGNYREAKIFARAQLLNDDEWFFPLSEDELKQRTNFHVLVVGTAGMNVPSSYFERVLSLAKEQGAKKK